MRRWGPGLVERLQQLGAPVLVVVGIALAGLVGVLVTGRGLDRRACLSVRVLAVRRLLLGGVADGYLGLRDPDVETLLGWCDAVLGSGRARSLPTAESLPSPRLRCVQGDGVLRRAYDDVRRLAPAAAPARARRTWTARPRPLRACRRLLTGPHGWASASGISVTSTRSGT